MDTPRSVSWLYLCNEKKIGAELDTLLQSCLKNAQVAMIWTC